MAETKTTTAKTPKMVRVTLEPIYADYLGTEVPINVNGEVHTIKVGQEAEFPEAHAFHLQTLKNNVVMPKR